MKWILPALVATVGLASAAQAVSLTAFPDQGAYAIGDYVTVTIIGDVSGAADAYAIFGRLLFDDAFLTPVGASQSQMTSFGGLLSWTLGALPGGELAPGVGFQDVFNQIAGLSPLPPDGNLTATATFIWTGPPGAADLVWADTLDFFGITSNGVLVATTAVVVPEPASAGLLALGLLVFAARRHRRR